jgi:hypothetical protein
MKQRLSRFNRLFFSALLLLSSVLVANPANATAPPPASNLCAIIQGLCDPAAPPLPDFRFSVRSGATQVTVTNNTRVTFPVTLRANGANSYTLSSVRFYDAVGTLNASSECYAFRTNVLSPSLKVTGQPGVATPWAEAIDNERWGAVFGPNQVTFSEIPRNKRTNVEMGISCLYNGQTYRRSILFQIDGFTDTSPTASFSFSSTNPPRIDATSVQTTGSALLFWNIRGDVGTCSITEVRADGSYSPGINQWGNDAYIKSNARQGSTLNGVPLQVTYPNNPGSFTYRFLMRCSKVADPIERTITATRTAAGGGGSGNPNTLNYGRGTRQF